MAKIITLCVCLLSVCAAKAEADPYTILPNGELAFNVSFHTEGSFICSPRFCDGSGTNSITLGTDPTLTLTFNGADRTVQLPAYKSTLMDLGEFVTVASGPGFTFPTTLNPVWPVIEFQFSMTHSSPVPWHRNVTFNFRHGGQPTITTGFHFITFPTGPNPPGFEYTKIIYSFVGPVLPGTTAVTPLQVKAGVVPEPTTMVLVGSGLLGVLYRRRQKASSLGAIPDDAR
jgi:hypothetical protein